MRTRMWKLVISAVVLVSGFGVPAWGQCEHAITMWDDYGDGWNGGTIDVYVNGELVLEAVTLEDGFGPETVFLGVDEGAEILVEWTPGGWPYECSYCVYGGLDMDVELACSGLAATEPEALTVPASCLEIGGACCYGSAPWVSCRFTSATWCAAGHGGTWQGQWTDCTDSDADGIADICEVHGACCWGPGFQLCDVTDQPTCEEVFFGIWKGAGTDCTDGDGDGFADICVPPEDGACCYDDSPQQCVITDAVTCESEYLGEWKGPGTDCEDADDNGLADVCEECEHSITMWDDYGDGWNDGFINVYVGDELVLEAVTLADGYGPETVTFGASAWDEIVVTWTPGGWPYECSYCVYGGSDDELVCSGLEGLDPESLVVPAECIRPLSACCFCDGTCQLLAPRDCQDQGGTPVEVFSCTPNPCGYMKMDPPPDADKPFPVPQYDGSCWQATAANMLAGAGYGVGTTVQARADNIYGQMKAYFGLQAGWIDAALQWWLNSSHNQWPSNPYKVIKVHGHKIPKFPWDNVNGPRFIGNELRRCHMVGLSISWPRAGSGIGASGHAFSAWGDNGGDDLLAVNPACIHTTDSDKDVGGDVQMYAFDDPNNPNPGGSQGNEGFGWYIDYSALNHPYIKHIATLAPTDKATDQTATQICVGSWRLQQSSYSPATDLHYKVGNVDADILTYRTRLDWPTRVSPTITEDTDPPRELTVDWNLSAIPVPFGTWVTITTEVVLPMYNTMYYEDVHFTYSKDGGRQDLPNLWWEVQTPDVADVDFPGITGGYVVGTVSLYDDPSMLNLIGEHRLQHEYSHTQNPEFHVFLLSQFASRLDAPYVGEMKFGHSYGLLSDEELWSFEDWMTEVSETQELPPEGEPLAITLDWEGLLPYPQPESFIDCNENGQPDELDIESGVSEDADGDGVPDECVSWTVGDVNCDGVIDFFDIDPFVMAITDPAGYVATYPDCSIWSADCNEDGVVDFFDIDPFVALITGG